MALLSVSQAAERLGVNRQRVHHRIRQGSLPAQQIGGRFVVDEADLLPLREVSHRPGRPLSERSVLALLLEFESESARNNRLSRGAVDHAREHPINPAEASRARKRLRDLLASCQRSDLRDEPVAPKRPKDPASDEERLMKGAAAIRRLLGPRAERRLFHVSPRDLDDLRDEPRLRLSGLSSPKAGIAAGDVVEAYVRSSDLAAVIDDYLMRPLESAGASARANVVLHAASDAIFDVISHAGPDFILRSLLMAADLAEHREPRSEHRAVDLLWGIAPRYLSVTESS